MRFDNRLADCQTQARVVAGLALARLVGAVKALEYKRQVGRIDATAGVADRELYLALVGGCAQYDLALVGIAQRV